MSKIPDEIKTKINEAASNYMQAMNTDDWEKKWVAQGAYTAGASFGYQLAHEEVARLKGLIEEMWNNSDYSDYGTREIREDYWERFKTENNL